MKTPEPYEPILHNWETPHAQIHIPVLYSDDQFMDADPIYSIGLPAGCDRNEMTDNPSDYVLTIRILQGSTPLQPGKKAMLPPIDPPKYFTQQEVDDLIDVHIAVEVLDNTGQRVGPIKRKKGRVPTGSGRV